MRRQDKVDELLDMFGMTNIDVICFICVLLGHERSGKNKVFITLQKLIKVLIAFL